MRDYEEARAISRLTERLAMRFPQLSGRLVEAVVAAAHLHFADAPIREFVPLLVEHDAVERLWSLAGSADEPPSPPRSGDQFSPEGAARV
jgi:hypothetical protein